MEQSLLFDAAIFLTAAVVSVPIARRLGLGSVLGYLLVWSGSLWLPILVHFINNATIVLASYFGRESEMLDAMENIGKAETWGYGIASAIISGVIIWHIAHPIPPKGRDFAK